MKKIIAIAMMAVMVLAMASCGDRGGSSDSEYTAENPLVIKCADSDTEDMASNIFFNQFKEYVESESEGRISVEIYPNSQLGDDSEMLKGIKTQTIQMYIGTGATASVAGEAAALPNLPCVFKDAETFKKAWEGEALDLYNQVLAEKTDSNFRCLANVYQGDYAVLTRNKPIESVNDLKGLKVRVTPTDINVNFWTNAGASPTPLSFGDVYTALNQGTIDGMDHMDSLFWAAKFGEVAKYMTLTGHNYGGSEVIVNAEWMDGLPEDLQQIILDGVAQFPELVKGMLADYDFQQLLKDDFGVTVVEASDDVKAKLRESAQPLYEHQRELVGDDIMDKYLELGGNN